MEWNIGYIINKRSILTPDKTAIYYDDMPITYKDLNDGTNRVANYLRKKGLKKGDRISVLLKNCPEFLQIYFASAKLGLIFVPLNFRLMGQEISYQLGNCGPRLLIFDDAKADLIGKVRSEIPVEVDKYIYLQSEPENVSKCPEWAEDFREMAAQSPVEEPELDEPVFLDDPLAIIYTSGVTGDAKGALLTHGQTYFKCFQNIFYTDMRSEDVYLSQLPLFHSGGLFVVVTPTLCRGATIVMRQRFKPEQFAEDIQKYKATIVFALTTMWRFILQTSKLDEVDTAGVRVVMGGGERTPKNLFDDLAKRGLYMQQVFGQTEN
nr:AMP-binding protein [Desulfobacterales bacterium]